MSDTQASQVAPEKDLVVKLRPTLVVAIGGTGKEIALRLRRRILQNDWNGRRITDLSRFPVASFVYFDTDTTQASETDRAQRADPLAQAVAFRDSERLQEVIDVGRYMKEIDNYPHIKEWLPKAELSTINTEKGAGQVRAISRLLFFHEFETLKQMIRRQGDAVLNNVGRQAELEDLKLDVDRQNLRVVVLCSAAGGTGSGSFIDLGLMIRSMRAPRPAQVDLVMLLPGGYKGSNEQRVNANAFAALMELEHVMRPGSNPPYVWRWTADGNDRPTVEVPYDDVYLVDTKNLAKEATDQVTHIYDMVADVLFEDFGSSDFANKKRSISVNQKQFKLDNYTPPLSSRFGTESLSYSLAFSSFGQSMIVTKGQVAVDTAAAEACQAMIKTFFNVGTEDSNRLPTPEQRDEFLEANFFLTRTSFADALEGIDDNSAINEPALVDELLRQENGGSIVASQEDQIHGDFQNDILGGTSEVANWVTLALQAFERRRADVIAPIIARSETGLAGRHVIMARQRLAMRLKGGGEDGIRAALFRYLDNRARGGLDYTIRLVEDSKLRIDEDIAWLDEARAKYDERAEVVRARFNLSLENLRMASQARWLRGPDRAAAELYLNHLRDETAFYVKLLLRRQACIEGMTFLRDMSDYLGTQRGVDTRGRIVWDGALAELVNGRTLVEQLLHELDAEVRLLQDAVSRQNAGTYVVLADSDSEAETALASSSAEIQQWAMEMFDGEGGSRTLFPVLEDDKKRVQLLGKVRGLAREKLAPRANRLRSVTDLLGAMPERQRLAVFERAMRRAMPWLNASFDRTGGRLPMADRFKLIVAVEDLAGFQRFERELKEARPFPFNHFDLVPSGLRDRVVIYCELSGIPLDTIISLGDEWRTAYSRERRGALPLHNHNSATRFANPVVPTNEEIETIRSCMKVFLRAVSFAILEREGGREAGYQFHLDGGDLMDVGTERHIRADGFLPIHFEEITRKLDQFERSLTPIQLLAASALLEWTSRFAYAPRMVRRDNRSAPFPGLSNLVAAELATLYLNRFRQTEGAERFARPEEIRDRLRGLIPQWTVEIQGSVDDLDPMDASYRQPDPANPSDQEAPRSVNKRRIVRDRFTAEELERLLASPAGTGVTTPPPIITIQQPVPVAETGRWFVSINRKVTGPFTANELLLQRFAGTFVITTNVLPEGGTKWLKALDVPELRRICETDPPGDEMPDDPLANPPPD